MKKILVPTDFSTGAWQAAFYAAHLACAAEANLILFHAYELQSIVSEASIVYMMDQVTRGKEFEHLRLWADRLREATGPELRVYYYCTMGGAAEEIQEAVSQTEPDLVVMGLRGAGGMRLPFFGSVTTEMMRQLARPLLIVPEHTPFQLPQNIVFAADYEKPARQEDLQFLTELVKLFSARLQMVYIKEPEPVSITSDKSAEAERMITSLENAAVSPDMEFLEATDIPKGLTAYVTKEKADWLVMVPRSHGLLHRIFDASNTERVAFETHIPLLTFPVTV